MKIILYFILFFICLFFIFKYKYIENFINIKPIESPPISNIYKNSSYNKNKLDIYKKKRLLPLIKKLSKL